MMRFISYLKQTIKIRLQAGGENTIDIAQPFLINSDDKDIVSVFIKNCQLNFEETIILLISLVPHLQPNFSDALLQEYVP